MHNNRLPDSPRNRRKDTRRFPLTLRGYIPFPPHNPQIDSIQIHIIDTIPIHIINVDTVLVIDTIVDISTLDPINLTFIFHLSHGHDVILHLTVLPTSYTETACFEYLWPRTGQVYTNSGTYFCPYMLHGQLVTDTLYLTVIKPSVTVASIPPVTVCAEPALYITVCQALSVHGILQARILEWVAISFSRRSSQPRDRTQVSCIAGRCFTV